MVQLFDEQKEIIESYAMNTAYDYVLQLFDEHKEIIESHAIDMAVQESGIMG